MSVKFKIFSGSAPTPIRATSGPGVYNLFSAEKVELKPNSVQKI